MNFFRADLHSHSTCSDGSLTPTQLVELAKTSGLSALSITDHDCISAYHTALPAAHEHGLEMVSGVEFSSLLGDVSIHILGYGFAINEPCIQNFCEKHQQRRNERNREILTLLNRKGMPIDEAALNALTKNGESPNERGVLGRPHIAQMMLKSGYVSSIREAFDKYIGEGGPCYAKGDFFTPEETIDIIQNVKGFAFIAHPHLIQEGRTTAQLLKMPFNGLECYYSMLRPEAHARWLKIANHRGWLISGGSDFHGDVIKPTVKLGCSWVNEEHFQILKERFDQNQADLSRSAAP